MADTFSPAKRREIMQSVRRERTHPEEELATLLRMAGVRFRRNVASLPGRPDFVISRARVVVFVHGCFWHGHIGCRKGRSLPKTNSQYWTDKVLRNQSRDRCVARRLRADGYSVFTVWACELTSGEIPRRLLVRLCPSVERSHPNAD